MANIDNTVIFAILKALSGGVTQDEVWEIANRESKMSCLMDPRRFFRGDYLKTPKEAKGSEPPCSWWPADEPESLENMIQAYFVHYAAENSCVQLYQKILSTCRNYKVASPFLQDLSPFQEEPAGLAARLFLCAKSEWEKKSPTQKWLLRHAPSYCSSENARPSLSSLSPLYSHPGDGGILSQIPSSFPPQQDHVDAPFFDQFAAVRRREKRWKVPYKELFGSARPGQGEYVEGCNLTYAYKDWQADLRPLISTMDFDQALEEERALMAHQHGYTTHPPKLCLAHYMERRGEDDNGNLTSTLTMTFGQSGYLEHHLYQKELAQNQAEQQALGNIFRHAKGNISSLRYCPWAACGGGVWVITQDNFLVLSLRTNVAEEAGKLGYSASGSYGRYTEQDTCRQNNTPGLAMCKELAEELGMEGVSPQDLTLISFGIDLNRCLIQFSYLLTSPLMAEDIFFCRQDFATTADEQMTLFVPLDSPDLCWSLLAQCEFEPGAAYSLVRLLQKRFGTL